MRVAITTRGPGAEFGVDESFGRAYWFLILDETREEWESIDNSEIRNSMNNAGMLAAKALAGYEVDVLITGETGPKAFRALKALGIEVFHNATGTAMEALQAWRAGDLPKAFLPKSQGSP